MKSTIALATLGLSNLASARPGTIVARQDPLRILPTGWTFNITGLTGPGCPDFGLEDEAAGQRHTRLTFGANTVDGSEIYYWYIAYPSLRVELGKTESVWCETELSYTETTAWNNPTPKSDYRLRLHKNGTKIVSTYDLPEGVKATVSFQYVDQDVTDTFTYSGPLASGRLSQGFDLGGSGLGSPVKAATCGATTIKFWTEVAISGAGSKGFVASESYDNTYYGIQLGFSYDWEKC